MDGIRGEHKILQRLKCCEQGWHLLAAFWQLEQGSPELRWLWKGRGDFWLPVPGRTSRRLWEKSVKKLVRGWRAFWSCFVKFKLQCSIVYPYTDLYSFSEWEMHFAFVLKVGGGGNSGLFEVCCKIWFGAACWSGYKSRNALGVSNLWHFAMERPKGCFTVCFRMLALLQSGIKGRQSWQ